VFGASDTSTGGTCGDAVAAASPRIGSPPARIRRPVKVEAPAADRTASPG
jgi:hypothetical protein